MKINLNINCKLDIVYLEIYSVQLQCTVRVRLPAVNMVKALYTGDVIRDLKLVRLETITF